YRAKGHRQPSISWRTSWMQYWALLSERAVDVAGPRSMMKRGHDVDSVPSISRRRTAMEHYAGIPAHNDARSCGLSRPIHRPTWRGCDSDTKRWKQRWHKKSRRYRMTMPHTCKVRGRGYEVTMKRT